MKQKYYVIVENFFEVEELGEFDSLLEANKMLDLIEHITHGESYIIVPHSHMKTLITKMEWSLLSRETHSL